MDGGGATGTWGKEGRESGRKEGAHDQHTLYAYMEMSEWNLLTCSVNNKLIKVKSKEGSHICNSVLTPFRAKWLYVFGLNALVKVLTKCWLKVVKDNNLFLLPDYENNFIDLLLNIMVILAFVDTLST